jgi:hypothetical protein
MKKSRCPKTQNGPASREDGAVFSAGWKSGKSAPRFKRGKVFKKSEGRKEGRKEGATIVPEPSPRPAISLPFFHPALPFFRMNPPAIPLYLSISPPAPAKSAKPPRWNGRAFVSIDAIFTESGWNNSKYFVFVA